MTSHNPAWAPDIHAGAERANRIDSGLLHGVVEYLKSNRVLVPIFALSICCIFAQSVAFRSLAIWFGQVLVALVPQLIVLHRFPAGALTREETRTWTRRLARANLFFIVNWATLGWHFWAPGNANHLMIQLILGATLAAHAASTGASRAIARPAMLVYLAAMVLTPLQGLARPESVDSALILTATAPLYVLFIVLVAKRNHARAHAAILVAEERNVLLAELVMAKLESDRGREHAEAANLAKSQFLANMSHELRTPLNAILGFSELIATRIFEHDPERNVEYAGLINSSGKHLLALINDILDLAKIEAGRWQLEEGEQDLHRIAEDCLQLVMWRAREGNATLENAIDPDVPLVFADERAVKQILLNLLSNAVKFTPAQGRIGTFAYLDSDGGLAFGVADTGVGIAVCDQEKVFDSFGQGKHDVAVADKGTGLGLAIVRGLAQAHGGRVRLESQVGKGTRVTVHMPAIRTRPRRRAVASA